MNNDIPEKCPVCYTKWTVTKLIYREIIHCEKCKKKADEIMKIFQTNPIENKNPKYSYKPGTSNPGFSFGTGQSQTTKLDNDAFLKELEEMLGSDDWDDFGGFSIDYRTKSEFKL